MYCSQLERNCFKYDFFIKRLHILGNFEHFFSFFKKSLVKRPVLATFLSNEAMFTAEPFDPFVIFLLVSFICFKKWKNPKTMKSRSFRAKKVSAFLMHQPNKVLYLRKHQPQRVSGTRKFQVSEGTSPRKFQDGEQFKVK